MRVIHLVCILLLQIQAFVAFSPPLWSPRSNTELFLANQERSCSRREAWKTASSVFAAVLLTGSPAGAKSDPLEADKQKLVAGYKRLNYLLDNWEKETSNCKTKTQYSSASSACERTPLKVQDYLGYRSTEDPLFRADKTMRRLEVLVPPDLEVAYLDAMEKYNEKAEEGSGNSYTSSWGEANPGGGKDRVELFVERAKANVVDARDALGDVIKILDLM